MLCLSQVLAIMTLQAAQSFVRSNCHTMLTDLVVFAGVFFILSSSSVYISINHTLCDSLSFTYLAVGGLVEWVLKVLGCVGRNQPDPEDD